jgi:rare lipoprotein A
MTFLKKIVASTIVATSSLPFVAMPAHASCGISSWYGPGLYYNRTASGAILHPGSMIAAHPYLPLGSWIRVTNQRNGRSVEILVADRGPYEPGRILDVSEAAARRLGMIKSGLAEVCISRI